MFPLTCDNPNHANHSNEVDWVEFLGTTTQPGPSGLWCDICYQLEWPEN